jgi:hypothetical protein
MIGFFELGGVYSKFIKIINLAKTYLVGDQNNINGIINMGNLVTLPSSFNPSSEDQNKHIEDLRKMASKCPSFLLPFELIEFNLKPHFVVEPVQTFESLFEPIFANFLKERGQGFHISEWSNHQKIGAVNSWWKTIKCRIIQIFR